MSFVNVYLRPQGMVASAQPAAGEPGAWDSMAHSAGYHPPPPPAAPAPSMLPKTVDYGHGHGRATPLVEMFTLRAFSRRFLTKATCSGYQILVDWLRLRGCHGITTLPSGRGVNLWLQTIRFD